MKFNLLRARIQLLIVILFTALLLAQGNPAEKHAKEIDTDRRPKVPVSSMCRKAIASGHDHRDYHKVNRHDVQQRLQGLISQSDEIIVASLPLKGLNTVSS